jgi:hypothetical protein
MPILSLSKLLPLLKVSKRCMRSSFTARVIVIEVIHILQLLILCIAVFLS